MIEIEALRERLCDMGFETEENEESMLCDAIKRAEQTILNYCNCESVPEQLYFTLLDMAAGEYLLASRTRGAEGAEIEKIAEGDVSVTFGGESLGDVIDKLLSSSREDLVSFRRVRW